MLTAELLIRLPVPVAWCGVCCMSEEPVVPCLSAGWWLDIPPGDSVNRHHHIGDESIERIGDWISGIGVIPKASHNGSGEARLEHRGRGTGTPGGVACRRGGLVDESWPLRSRSWPMTFRR